MRLSTSLFVLCSALTLPACLAATGESSDSALVRAEDGSYDFGPTIDLPEGEAGYEDGFAPGFGHDYNLGPSLDLGVEDCGCVFPSHDPEVNVATICGEAVCFEEQSYFCTHEGMAVRIGACVGVDDGAFDLTDYDFPEGDDEAQPSSCQGDAGTCSGDDATSCEAKAGCTFMPSGECVGEPVPCPSRNQAACTTFGEGCFHVSPFED